MKITASDVNKLRKSTGAGMMDCKKALNETGGDLNAAADWLRTKGIAKADKKASRIAAEGLVAVAISGSTGALVEVNSETDFVARRKAMKEADFKPYEEMFKKVQQMLKNTKSMFTNVKQMFTD